MSSCRATNAKRPDVPVTIRQAHEDPVEGLGPGASMRTWQELPCDGCGGSHVNGADRWYVAEMTPVRSRYTGCGSRALTKAYQSILDEAHHIAAASPDVVLALIARVRAAEAQLVDDGCDVCGAAAWTECATFCSEHPDNLGSRSLRLRVRQGQARIAELEAALVEACLGWEDAKHDGPNDEEWVVIRRLRELAGKR